MTQDLSTLPQQIRQWSHELGFQQTGITDSNLDIAEQRLQQWLDKGFHGDMKFMAKHGLKRSRPELLVTGTRSIISVRLDYLPQPQANIEKTLKDPATAFISRYALGRDYHKMMRNRLQKLANKIEQAIGPFGYRAFVDSAPVMEKAIAEKAGLGWIGKHSNIINAKAGSWFFLGEIYTDLPLKSDQPAKNHCGDCRACLDVCPTQAIVAPYQVDARLCVSYLTIELHGAIPVELRPLIGNRIYGCDDCQLACPWNRFARLTAEQDFSPRHHLDTAQLIELFQWDEATFLKKTEGSAIRRIGHQRWRRNIAVALGNGPRTEAVLSVLNQQLSTDSELVREHIAWALAHIQSKPA